MGFVSLALPLAFFVAHVEMLVRGLEHADADERAARLALSMTNPCLECMDIMAQEVCMLTSLACQRALHI